MKKTAVTLIGVIIAVIVLHAFKTSQNSTVTGRIANGNGTAAVVARKDGDSVEATIDPQGFFLLNLGKGAWQLEVKKVNSTRQVSNIFLDSVIINKAADVDLGNIIP
jgi:hypothetical protein